MLIGIEKFRATKNGYELGRFVRAKSFVKRISKDYFLKYRNFICNAKTATRINKLLKRARSTHDGEGWRITVNNSIPANRFYVNGKF